MPFYGILWQMPYGIKWHKVWQYGYQMNQIDQTNWSAAFKILFYEQNWTKIATAPSGSVQEKSWQNQPYSPISLACSPTTTPHGPTTYFSKKLRQKVLLSRTKRNSRSSSSKKSASKTFSSNTQKLIATQVTGISRLDVSSDNLPRN